MKRYEKEQEKIKKMEEYIDRFRAGIKARQAKGRQKNSGQNRANGRSCF